MLCDRGANALLSTVDIDAALDGTAAAAAAVHLHLSGYALFDEASRAAGRYALAVARERGLSTSVDAASAGPRRRVGAATFLEWIHGVDLLLANADEAVALAGTAEPARLTGSARNVVVKRGAEGAGWAGAGTGTRWVAAQPATALDVTGAGDAFAAGLLSAWLAGAEPADALRAGARLGARAVSRTGARPGAVLHRPGPGPSSRGLRGR